MFYIPLPSGSFTTLYHLWGVQAFGQSGPPHRRGPISGAGGTIRITQNQTRNLITRFQTWIHPKIATHIDRRTVRFRFAKDRGLSSMPIDLQLRGLFIFANVSQSSLDYFGGVPPRVKHWTTGCLIFESRSFMKEMAKFFYKTHYCIMTQ